MLPKIDRQSPVPQWLSKNESKICKVLSHTVSSAMLMATSGGLLPPSAAGTAELIAKFDTIFDCLNSTSFECPKIYNHPLSSQPHHFKFIADMCSLVGRIKVTDQKLQRMSLPTQSCGKYRTACWSCCLWYWLQLSKVCPRNGYLSWKSLVPP